MRYIYSFLFYLITPLLFLRLLWRSRKMPEYRHHWLERLGFCPYIFNECIWIHAVSVGETIAAIPLVHALKKKYPDLPLLITNMTPTGAARAKATFGSKVMQAYIPYDLPGAMRRFVSRVHPLVCIVMETEIWPNMLAECHKRIIPTIITNARLSEKSEKTYRIISSLTRQMLNDVTVIAAQSQADANRFINLGAAPEKVKVTGSIKFDLEIPSDLSNKAANLKDQLGHKRLIWIAASTHPGEEEIILAAHRLILKENKNALLILVPRHLERFESVAELVSQQGFTMCRRSLNETCLPETTIYLGDTMGEVMLMYSVCDVAFVGGSFISIGGHNMLEPAALCKPILTGPNLFNFVEISNMLFAAEGMLKVENANQLAQAVNKLFADKSLREKLGNNAYSVTEANKGALAKQMQLILNLF